MIDKAIRLINRTYFWFRKPTNCRKADGSRYSPCVIGIGPILVFA